MKEKALIVKPVPVPNQYKHPPPPNSALCNHEFTMGLIGKSCLIFQRLKEPARRQLFATC